jgi:hypothetical protein
MKTLNFLILTLLVFSMMIFSSCKKTESDTQVSQNSTRSSLNVMFIHKAGNAPLVLNTTQIPVSNNNSFVCSTLDYYMSHLMLFTEQGDTIKDGYDYRLIRASSNSDTTLFQLKNLPSGKYTGFQFYIGVDSITNKTTDNVGDLDISSHMAWTWNTGYKFLAVEGTATSPTGNKQGIIYHLGFNENYILKDFLTGANAKPFTLSPTAKNSIVFNVDISKIADGVDMQTTNSIMSAGADNQLIMRNFTNKCMQFGGFFNQ